MYKCQAKDKQGDLFCNREFYEDEYQISKDKEKCILHCDKAIWHKKQDIKKFWEQIQKDLLDKYMCCQGDRELEDKNIVFRNVQFPKFEKDYEYDKKDPLSETSNFYFNNYIILPNGHCDKDDNNPEYTDKLIEKCNVEFIECTFWENADFKRYNFNENITFKNCTFYKGIFLNDMLEATIEFRECRFNNQSLDFSNKVFNKIFIFTNCENISSINFQNTRFKDTVSFAYSKFEKTIFEEITFENMAVFLNTEFFEDINFEYCTFLNSTFFNETKIYSKIDFKNAILKTEVNFLDIKNKDDKDLNSDNIANRETARIIKDSFEQQNNIIEANKFYALEIKEREKELKSDKKEGKNIFEWFVFKIHGLASNHSQDWTLALFWIFIIGFLSSYYDFNLIKESHLQIQIQASS